MIPEGSTPSRQYAPKVARPDATPVRRDRLLISMHDGLAMGSSGNGVDFRSWLERREWSGSWREV